MEKGFRKQTNLFTRLSESRYYVIIALFETCDKQKHVNKVIKSIEIDSLMYVVEHVNFNKWVTGNS